jgi:hypothetical protein
MVAGKEETVRSILRKEFVPAEGGRSHRYFEYIVDDVAISRTYVSHGGKKDLDDDLLSKMGEQCHLSGRQFHAFAKCWMSAEDYRRILIDKGIIPGP